jgi:hypothetical protein
MSFTQNLIKSSISGEYSKLFASKNSGSAGTLKCYDIIQAKG